MVSWVPAGTLSLPPWHAVSLWCGNTCNIELLPVTRKRSSWPTKIHNSLYIMLYIYQNDPNLLYLGVAKKMGYPKIDGKNHSEMVEWGTPKPVFFKKPPAALKKLSSGRSKERTSCRTAFSSTSSSAKRMVSGPGPGPLRRRGDTTLAWQAHGPIVYIISIYLSIYIYICV